MLVLWVLFFLSVVALNLGFKNRINIRLRSLNNRELRLFYLAKEGINQAIVKLAEDNPDFDCFTDNWSKDFSLQRDEGLLSYKVIDEDRFININTASQEVLNNIKSILPEISPQTIENIGKTRPFNLKQEILDATGISQDVFYGDAGIGKLGLRDLITVFSDGRLNINTASQDVLMIIPGMTPIAAEAIIGRRKSATFEKNETLSEELSLLGLTPAQVSSIVEFTKVDSSVFRIKTAALSSQRRIAKKLEIVLDRQEEKFKVLLFREN